MYRVVAGASRGRSRHALRSPIRAAAGVGGAVDDEHKEDSPVDARLWQPGTQRGRREVYRSRTRAMLRTEKETRGGARAPETTETTCRSEDSARSVTAGCGSPPTAPVRTATRPPPCATCSSSRRARRRGWPPTRVSTRPSRRARHVSGSGGATHCGSAWTFTLGFFNWLAFVYIGVRARHAAWTLAGFAYLMPLILTAASFGTQLFHGFVVLQLFVSAASVAHALYLRPYYRAVMFGDAPRNSLPAPPQDPRLLAAGRAPAPAEGHGRGGGRGHPRRPPPGRRRPRDCRRDRQSASCRTRSCGSARRPTRS